MTGTWEERMSARARTRLEQQEAREAARLAQIEAGTPRLEGESGVVGWDGHYGHRLHEHPWHLGVVMCSCGARMGVYSFVVPEPIVPPEPCPVCVARGIPLDEGGGDA